MRSTLICILAALALCIPRPGSVRAADHQDSIPSGSDPAADLADLFVWPSRDGSRVQIALTMAPFATPSMRFSQAVLYVMHTRALAHYGDAAPARATDILCSFDIAQQVSCWVGNQDYVSGNAGTEAGLRSRSGRILVFTGARSDPFFFNAAGFEVAIESIHQPPSTTAQCPSISAPTSQQLITQLRTAPDGSPARDYMLNSNVLALVLSIDRTLLVPAGAPILSVWASAHKRGL